MSTFQEEHCNNEMYMDFDICRSYCTTNNCQSVLKYCTSIKYLSEFKDKCRYYFFNSANGLYNFQEVVTYYCNGYDLANPACKFQCFNTSANCDAQLYDYCRSSERGTDADICSCFKDHSYYTLPLKKKFSIVENKELRDALYSLVDELQPYCIPGSICNISDYLPKDTTSCNEDLALCISTVNFDNLGVFEVKCPPNTSKSDCVKIRSKCSSVIENSPAGRYLPKKQVPSKSTPSTPSTTTTTTSTSSSQSSTSTTTTSYYIWIILGVVLIFIIGLALGIYFYMKHKKSEK